jgi:hypothetical protein
MNRPKPWQPHLDSLPLFNPFEPSTKWTEQIGADDQIEIEDEQAPKESEAPDSKAKSGTNLEQTT